MARPTLSLTLPTFGSSVPANQWHRLLDLARAVDDAGVDRVLLTDHVVMGEHLDRYPFGDFHFQPDVPWLEPLSTIAAIAAVTRRRAHVDEDPHRSPTPRAATGEDVGDDRSALAGPRRDRCGDRLVNPYVTLPTTEGAQCP